MPRAAIQEIGATHGYLTVLSRDAAPNNTHGGKCHWLCKCNYPGCHNFALVEGRQLRNGNTVSCGCMRSGDFRKKAKEVLVKGEKTCRRCCIKKPLNEFKPHDNLDGLYSYCKKCVYEKSKERRDGAKGDVVAARCLASVLICSAKRRAKGLPCELNLDEVAEIILRGRCELTGWPLSLSAKPYSFYRPSIDQIVAGKGYGTGNWRVVCWGVNRMMEQHGDTRLLDVADAIRAKRNNEQSNHLVFGTHGLV